MAGKSRKGSPKGKAATNNQAASVPGSMDMMVSGSLKRPAGIPSEMKQIPQRSLIGDSVILPDAEPAGIVQPVLSDDSIRAQWKLDLAEISDEIELTLMHLEQSNSQGSAATDQEESREKPSLLPATTAEASVSVHTPQSSPAEPAAPPAIDSDEEELWKRLETLRSKVAYRSPNTNFFQRHRNLILALAAVIVALVSGALYFTYSVSFPRVSEILGRVLHSETQQAPDSRPQQVPSSKIQVPNSKTQRVQEPKRQMSGAMRPEKANPAGRRKDPALASPAQKSRSSQETRPVSDLVEETGEENSTAPDMPAPNLETAGTGTHPLSKPVKWVEISAEPVEQGTKAAEEQPRPQTQGSGTGGASSDPTPQSSQAVSSSAPPASQPHSGTAIPNAPPSGSKSRPSEDSSPPKP